MHVDARHTDAAQRRCYAMHGIMQLCCGCKLPALPVCTGRTRIRTRPLLVAAICSAVCGVACRVFSAVGRHGHGLAAGHRRVSPVAHQPRQNLRLHGTRYDLGFFVVPGCNRDRQPQTAIRERGEWIIAHRLGARDSGTREKCDAAASQRRTSSMDPSGFCTPSGSALRATAGSGLAEGNGRVPASVVRL